MKNAASPLANYTLVETLNRGHFWVSRCVRDSDQQAVIVKAFDPALRGSLARLRYENRILRLLGSENVHTGLPHLLEFFDAEACALVFADRGAYDLIYALQRGPKLALAEILTICLKCAEALARVHARQIIHKDINPRNVVYNQATGEVEIIDFGISVPDDSQRKEPLANLEGTLAYLSPEQTGRTNIEVDYRTDFYALGATLYQLLTGSVPFGDTDPTALMHAVLSRPARRVQETDSTVPDVVGDMVAKLLQKAPEERYQSAYGIVVDLQTCLARLAAHQPLERFALAQSDQCDRLELSNKLYGRDSELTTLRAAFMHADTGHCAVAFVGGLSGAGKSTLVDALRTSLWESRPLYAGGKFEQLNQHVPFSAFAQVIGGFIQHVLAGDPASVEPWRARVQKAVGRIGHALIDIVPVAELLIGSQPELPTLPPEQTENRLLRVLGRVLLAFCSEQTLVLFLDDLQWADTGTFKLLRELLGSVERGVRLFVIGAYRSNEVSAAGQFGVFQAHVAQLSDIKVVHVDVGPLSDAAIAGLVRDALRGQESTDLAALIARRTGGNALFVASLLKFLWSHKLLAYDSAAGRWSWDAVHSAALSVTDNVAALLAEKLKSMSPQVLELLAYAACIGDQVSVKQVAETSQIAHEEVVEAFWTAAREGILLALNHNGDVATGLPTRYRFAHDSVHLACYSVLSETRRAHMHLAMGRNLAKEHSADTHGEWLFSAVGHLNRGLTQVQDSAEVAQIARLNFLAGQEAKRAAAYAQAHTYFATAAQLNVETADKNGFGKELELEWADAEFLDGHFDAALERYTRLIANAKSNHEKATLLTRRADLMGAVGKQMESCNDLCSAATCLGLPVTRDVKAADIGLPLLKVYFRLRYMNLQRLQHLPAATDPDVLLLLQVLKILNSRAFVSSQHELGAFVGVNMMLLTLRHGSTENTRLAISSAAVVIMAAFKDFKMAQRLASIVDAISTDLPSDLATFTSFAALLTHLHIHPQKLMRQAMTLAEEARQDGYNHAGILLDAFTRGMMSYVDLDGVALIGGRFLGTAEHMGATDMAFSRNCLQFLRCLRGETLSGHSLSDADYDEDDERRKLEDVKQLTPIAAMRVMQTICAVLTRRYDIVEQLEKVILDQSILRAMGGISCYGSVMVSFCITLAQTQDALDRGANQVKAPRRFNKWVHDLKIVIEDEKSVYGGIPLLLDAELAALRGDSATATTLYERAVPRLEDSGYRVLGVLGAEAAGRFYERQRMKPMARDYIRRAYDTARAWGAKHKATLLEKEFPSYLETGSVQAGTHESTGTAESVTQTRDGVGATIDGLGLHAIAQAKSVEAIMNVAVDVMVAAAGASGGALLTREGQEWVPRASRSTTAAASAGVPMGLVQLCARTQETIQINQNDRSDAWGDAYFVGKEVKSAICVPLVRNGTLLGVAYCESSMIANAFKRSVTMESIAAVAAQTALVLESSQLRNNLQEQAVRLAEARRRSANDQTRHDNFAFEERLAGGFAHEMRNALSAASLLLHHVVAVERAPGTPGPADVAADAVMAILALAEAKAGAGEHEHLQQLVRPIVDYLESSNTALTAVDKATQRAMQIVTLIMDYAKIGEERRGSDEVEVDAVLARLTQEMNQQFIADGIDLHVKLTPHVRARGTEAHFSAILSNLLLNAREALVGVDDQRLRQLKVELNAHDNTLELTVQDNGVGMTPEVQARIGTPFYTTKGVRGTGLGFGTVKKLVALYDGEMQIESTPNAGSKFSLRFAREALGGKS